jgi:hypothetical protein
VAYRFNNGVPNLVQMRARRMRTETISKMASSSGSLDARQRVADWRHTYDWLKLYFYPAQHRSLDADPTRDFTI